MLRVSKSLGRIVRVFLSFVHLVLVILTIPLAFDAGGIRCGLSFSYAIFTLYFFLTTVRLLAKRSHFFQWISLLYYLQHAVIPSLLTFFLSYYTNDLHQSTSFTPVDVWRYFITNSTPIFTILEGFCLLLLIQAIGNTIKLWETDGSDGCLIASLVASGSIITVALYFLYRVYVLPFTIGMLSASLVGSILTVTMGIGLFGIVSSKGSMIESALLFAYIVHCIYETFPALSEDASNTLSSLLPQTTFKLLIDIPQFSPHLSKKTPHIMHFLASNLSASLSTIWGFLMMASQKLAVSLVINLTYRLAVIFAATKIIPAVYDGASSFTSGPVLNVPTRNSSHVHLSNLTISESCDYSTTRNDTNNRESISEKDHSPTIPEKSSNNLAVAAGVKIFNNKNKSELQHSSTTMNLIYAYSPCIIIAMYTHLMMRYTGELETNICIWGWWLDNSDTSVVVHPWEFWNWINMITTLLIYTAELMEY